MSWLAHAIDVLIGVALFTALLALKLWFDRVRPPRGHSDPR